ncbi:hypothetical protein Tco_0236640 [Tanacetum coccineum]
MEDLNITMEEYIRLEEERAQRHGRTFNWQTVTFGKVESYEDEDDCFIDFKTEFHAIVFDNTLTSVTVLLCAPTISTPNKNMIDFRISLDDEEYTLIFDENSFSYKLISVNDLKKDSENDEVLKPSSSELTVDCFDDLDSFKDFENEFPAIVYNDGLTSKSDLEVEPPVSSGHINKFETSLSKYDERGTKRFTYIAPLPAADQRHPWLRYQIEEYTEGIIHSYEQRLETIWSRPVNRVHVLDFEGLTLEMRQDLVVRLRMVYTGEGQQLGGVRRRMTWRQFILALGLHTEQEMAEAGFGAYWDGSDRLIPDKGDLRDYWIEISSDRDFLGPAPSYVLIQDPVRRLCHMLIAYSIFGRRQAPEKVTGVDLFYLRNMDRGTTNVPHLLAQYLFRHVVTRELPLIDLHELGRLNICLRFGDTWAWVAQGPERQQAAAAGAHEADEAGPAVDEGAQEIPAPAQAPPPPPPAS